MATTVQAPDLAAIKGRKQVTWSSGDYARIGNTLVIMGELLCEAADLRAGKRVLDVATGSGNTALSAARRFFAVTGIDYVPSLLEQASQRAEAEGSPIAFTEGDAEAIPFPDARLRNVMLQTPQAHARAAAPERTTAPDGLTRREQQVVAQIAQGKGNREIADALFIAEKTVEMHVTNSLSKLGFHSRAQVAVWASEQARAS